MGPPPLAGESAATLEGREADLAARPQVLGARVEEVINEKKRKGEI
jgi:integrase/recombinase XerD